MKVVITTATEIEVTQIKEILAGQNLQKPGIQLSFHVCGVGLLSSTFSLAKLIFEKKPDLIVQAGIAGTFSTTLALGTVVAVRDEILADIGVEENNRFLDLFDLGLAQENGFPFTGSKLSNTYLSHLNYLEVDEVTGITINEISTRQARIETLRAKYNPVTESMEGAALHYCCLQTGTPFIQIRAISNYIGERDKEKWNFKDALQNLTSVVTEFIKQLDLRHSSNKK
jgi:futalosine hydrolase